MCLLESQEVVKQLNTTLVRIDTTGVEQVRHRRPLRLANLRLDRHRYNSSWQVAPELLAHALFSRRQPDKLARTSRRVSVGGKIRGQLIVQGWRKESAARGNLLQPEVRRRVEISDENDCAVVSPALIDVAQQRFGVWALMTDEVFL